MRSLAFALLLLLMAGAVAAAPSMNGYTGLLAVPTADSLRAGEVALGAYVLNQTAGRHTTYLGSFGASKGLEVGLTNVRFKAGPRETMLFAKYTFLSGEDGKTSVAAGIYDPTNEVESTAYFVASRSLKMRGTKAVNPRVHLGAGGGLLDGVFAGFSVDVGRALTAMVEFDGDKINGGARLYIMGMNLTAGWLDGLRRAVFGITYTAHLR